MKILIDFYKETFKRDFIRPVQVFLAEVNTPIELLKTIVYISALIYFTGLNPPKWVIGLIALGFTYLSWQGGKFLIRHRIPHLQNEITNELNPQMQKINELAKKLNA